MSIPRDKLLHLGMGLAAMAAGYVGLEVFRLFGLGPALAYITTVVGLGYEAQQYIRKEGVVDMLDAIATAAPGWATWAFLEFVL